jgi:hypothetical protein
MSTPQDISDSESDDDADSRVTKLIVQGMVIPFLATNKGQIIISY